MILLITVFVFSVQAFPRSKKPMQDSHNSIYTPKIKRIVNAMNIGEFSTDTEYFAMLKTACDRNKCSSLETQTIQSVGQQIVFCQIKHLKAHGIENPDATSICKSSQAMLGCDTLATSLLRKMCYTGNQYSLKTWQEKELRNKARNRMPASKK